MEPKIKPKLVWSGEGWVLTFISLRDGKADRVIDFHHAGEKLRLEINPCSGSKSMIAVKLQITKRA